jgi:serine/threonine protein kinase
MIARIPVSEEKAVKDSLPPNVLPDGTLLNDCYTVHYKDVGGMSVVYEGMKEEVRYFIKEVAASDIKKVMALQQEKTMIERLNHPSIPKIHDFFEHEGYYYLVTDFIEGKSLDAVYPPGSETYMKEKEISSWAWQLYDIFEYLHSQEPPIIFRDLKPQNMIRDKYGFIHLVDFGIARIYKENRDKDTISMGTALTASPEHYGGKQTDERSDIYTLGATLHYLLTNGRNVGHGLFEYCSIRNINPEITAELDQVILRAVALLPEDRYQSIQEMRQAHLNACQHKLDTHFKEASSTRAFSSEKALPPLPDSGKSRIFTVTKTSKAPVQGFKEKVFSRLSAVAVFLVPLLCLAFGFMEVKKAVNSTFNGSTHPLTTQPLPHGDSISRDTAPSPQAARRSQEEKISHHANATPSISLKAENTRAMAGPKKVSATLSTSLPEHHHPALISSKAFQRTAVEPPAIPPPLSNSPANVFSANGSRYEVPQDQSERTFSPAVRNTPAQSSYAGNGKEQSTAYGGNYEKKQGQASAQPDSNGSSPKTTTGSASHDGFVPASDTKGGVNSSSSGSTRSGYGFIPASEPGKSANNTTILYYKK